LVAGAAALSVGVGCEVGLDDLAPLVEFKATPSDIYSGQELSFDASGTHFVDANGTPILDHAGNSISLDVPETGEATGDDPKLWFVIQYGWNFGDPLDTATKRMPEGDLDLSDPTLLEPADASYSYTYALPGTYNVSLTATAFKSEDGETVVDGTGSNTITVKSFTPTAAITATATSGNAPLTVDFSAAGTSMADELGAPLTDTTCPGCFIVQYKWTVMDGTTTVHTENNPATFDPYDLSSWVPASTQIPAGDAMSYTFATAGAYTVNVEAVSGVWVDGTVDPALMSNISSTASVTVSVTTPSTGFSGHNCSAQEQDGPCDAYCNYAWGNSGNASSGDYLPECMDSTVFTDCETSGSGGEAVPGSVWCEVSSTDVSGTACTRYRASYASGMGPYTNGQDQVTGVFDVWCHGSCAVAVGYPVNSFDDCKAYCDSPQPTGSTWWGWDTEDPGTSPTCYP